MLLVCPVFAGMTGQLDGDRLLSEAAFQITGY